MAIFVNGLASIAGAFNYITTVVNMRAPGMTMFRMPMTVWSLFITAILLAAGRAGALGGGRAAVHGPALRDDLLQP